MKEISAVEIQNLLSSGHELNIIDVREADELENGKIPGSIHIPLGLIEFRMVDLDKSKDYYIVCHAGGRSSRAVQFLKSHGFKVTNITGGMLSWESRS